MKSIKAHLRNAITLIIIVFTIIICQIILSIYTASGAYEIAEAKINLQDLGQKQESLERLTDALSSPQYLSLRAEQLGMVVNATPVYLRMSDGVVLGSPTPASPDNKISSGGAIPNAMLDYALTQQPAFDPNGVNSITPTSSPSPMTTPAPSNVPQVLTGSLPSVQTR